MSNRCPSCSKFVALSNDEEPELCSVECDEETGEVDAVFRITSNCEECGEELKEAELEMSEVSSAELQSHLEDCPKESERMFEVEFDGEVSRDIRIEGRGRVKTFHVVTATFEVSCACGEHFSVTGTAEESAGAMESLG